MGGMGMGAMLQHKLCGPRVLDGSQNAHASVRFFAGVAA